MKTILILALEGVMDSSLAITLDTIRAGQVFLSRAGKLNHVRLLVAGHRKAVRTGAGLQLKPDLRFMTRSKEQPGQPGSSSPR